MRFFRSRALIVTGIASLMAGGSLALSGVAPAGASPTSITVHCPADDLGAAIYAAPAGSTLLVDGTCTGNFYIDKDLTLSGPATLDGGGVATVLNVMAGTVVLNNLTIQDGVGSFGFGGGLWNSGQLTLNRSVVTNNHATNYGGGVFNFGQLTLNGSIVSHNTDTNGVYSSGGGIFNCATSLKPYLCTGTPGSLTLNYSIVSDNVAGADGGGVLNDPQAVMTLNGSTVSGNTAGGNGGGILNNGTATLNSSMLSNNSSTGGVQTWSGGGGLSTTNTSTTRLSHCIVRANTAAWLAGGIFAGGPTVINTSIVTGNSAGNNGGGLVAWDGPTTVAYSVFANNADHGPNPDQPAGVWVSPPNFGGFFTNHPTFTTTNSIYS
jgi:hypothetical protein